MILFIYFGLAYLLSWLIWLPLYGPHFGVSGLPILPFHHSLGGLGPLLSAFITTSLFSRREKLKQLLRQCFQLKPFLYLLVALFSPFILSILASISSFLFFQTPLDLSSLILSREFSNFHLGELFAYNLLFFGWGEEVGWRGFALPRFQKRFNSLTASIILTFLWAIWHWPTFLYRPGYTSMDLAGVIGWGFSLMTGSILLTWLYNSSKGSILACAVFHSTIDIAFTSENISQEATNILGFLITTWGILTIVIFKPQNLSRWPKIKISD